MASSSRRQLGLLAGLAIVLLAVLVYNRDDDSIAATTASPTRARQQAVRTGQPEEVEPVRLDALTRVRPEPQTGARNPFRFRPAPAPGPAMLSRPQAGAPGGPNLPGAPAGPVGPPPPPPMALKFIGVVERTPSQLKLAVLSDGRNVFYGREGEVIEGRYRIERIGVESIEMSYVDGRGRQTLRLSGS